MIESVGTFKSISKDILTGGMLVTFLLDKIDPTELIELGDKQITVSVKKYSKKRGLDANGYYWVLLQQLAKINQVSNAFQHNLMLIRYGTLEDVDGKIPKVLYPDDFDVMEMVHLHLMPTSEVLFNDGIVYRWYQVIKGSHEYSQEEMARLIDGLVSECKEVGISTLTPKEERRLIELWKAS